MNLLYSSVSFFACSSLPNISPRSSIDWYIPSTDLRFRNIDRTPMPAYLGCKSPCKVDGLMTQSGSMDLTISTSGDIAMPTCVALSYRLGIVLIFDLHTPTRSSSSLSQMSAAAGDVAIRRTFSAAAVLSADLLSSGCWSTQPASPAIHTHRARLTIFFIKSSPPLSVENYAAHASDNAHSTGYGYGENYAAFLFLFFFGCFFFVCKRIYLLTLFIKECCTLCVVLNGVGNAVVLGSCNSGCGCGHSGSSRCGCCFLCCLCCSLFCCCFCGSILRGTAPPNRR